MTHYIALSPSQIARMHHHTLGGLRLKAATDDASPDTLLNDVLVLKENPDALEDILKHLQRVWAMWWIVRAFYWFFNLNQYRTHHYTLQCYLALTLYEERNNMHINPDLENNDWLTAGFFVTATAAGALLIAQHLAPDAMNELQQRMMEFAESLKPSFRELPYVDTTPPAPQSSATETDRLLHKRHPEYASTKTVTSHEDEFTVTAEMRDDMSVLGLNSYAVGETCTLDALKKAWRTLIKKHSPDRTHQSEPFLTIHAAFKQLTDTIKQTNAGNAHLVSHTDNLYNNLTRNVNRFCEEVTELTKDVKQYGDRVTQLHNGVTQLHNGVTQLHNGVTQLHNGVTQLHNGVTQLHSDVAHHCKNVTQLREDIQQELLANEETGIAQGLLPISDEEFLAFSNDNDYFEQQEEVRMMAFYDYNALNQQGFYSQSTPKPIPTTSDVQQELNVSELK